MPECFLRGDPAAPHPPLTIKGVILSKVSLRNLLSFGFVKPETLRHLASAAAVVLLASGCGDRPPSTELDRAEPANGRLLLRQYACGSCHEIPGVANSRGNAGPSLEAVGSRIYLAGMLPNTPANMTLWIRAPQQVDPLTTMPDLQVPEPHARDMTAYLHTLR